MGIKRTSGKRAHGKKPRRQHSRATKGRSVEGKAKSSAKPPSTEPAKSLSSRTASDKPKGKTSFFPSLIQRGVTFLQSSSTAAITSGTSYASSATGAIFRATGSILYSSATETLPQLLSFFQSTLFEGKLPEDGQKDEPMELMIHHLGIKTGKAFQTTATLADRTVTQVAQDITDLTSGVIAKGVPAIPVIIYTDIATHVVSHVVQTLTKGTADPLTTKTIAFLASELFLHRISSGKLEFTDAMITKALGMTFFTPHKAEFAHYLLADIFGSNTLVNNAPIFNAAKRVLKESFKLTVQQSLADFRHGKKVFTRKQANKALMNLFTKPTKAGVNKFILGTVITSKSFIKNAFVSKLIKMYIAQVFAASSQK